MNCQHGIHQVLRELFNLVFGLAHSVILFFTAKARRTQGRPIITIPLRSLRLGGELNFKPFET
jgi:hypothetical protein